jgi:hypothetical protein
MLLDIGSVLGGIGLAVVGFVVVILVCVLILRLLAAILPSYEDRSGPAAGTGQATETAPAAPEESSAPAMPTPAHDTDEEPSG